MELLQLQTQTRPPNRPQILIEDILEPHLVVVLVRVTPLQLKAAPVEGSELAHPHLHPLGPRPLRRLPTPIMHLVALTMSESNPRNEVPHLRGRVQEEPEGGLITIQETEVVMGLQNNSYNVLFAVDHTRNM